MKINIPYEIGEIIQTPQGSFEVKSLHIYIDKVGDVANIRVFAGHDIGYITVQKKGEK